MYPIIFFLIISIFFKDFLWAKKISDLEKIVVEDAQSLIYKRDDFLKLKGKVKIFHKGRNLEAQYVEYSPKSKVLKAFEDVVLKEKEREIYGDRLILNIENNQGRMDNISSYHKPNFYRGKLALIKSRDHYDIKDATITTCNQKSHHYFIEAKRVDLKLDDRFLAYSLWFNVGGSSIFYLPFYWRSLKDKKSHFSLKPGYSKEFGWTVKAKYHYYISEKNRGELILDYYEKRGLGRGINHIYSLGKKSRGRINIYFIKEDKILDRDIRSRWAISNQYYQSFPQDLILTSNINYISDKSFSSDYSEGIKNLINEVRSNISLTKKVPSLYTLRATYQREDNLYREVDKLLKHREMLPKLTFNTKRLRIGKRRWFYRGNAELGRKFERVDPEKYYYYNFLQSRWNFLRNYRLKGGIFFSPKIGIEAKLKSRESYLEEKPFTKISYYGNFLFPLRLYKGKIRITPSHKYRRSLLEEEIYENRSRLEYIHYLSRKVNLSSSFGYNYLKKEYEDLNTQLSISKEGFDLKRINIKKAKLYLHHKYSLKKNKLESIDLSFNVELERDKRRYLFYLGGNYIPHSYTLIKNRFSGEIFKNLRISLNLWYNLKRGDLFQGEIIFFRDLHCFESCLIFQRNRIYYSSKKSWEDKILYKINLKGFRKFKSSVFTGGSLGDFGILELL